MSISLEKFVGYRMDCTKETLDEDGKMEYESFDKFTFEYDAKHYFEKHPEEKWKYDKLKELDFVFQDEIIDLWYQEQKSNFFSKPKKMNLSGGIWGRMVIILLYLTLM